MFTWSLHLAPPSLTRPARFLTPAALAVDGAPAPCGRTSSRSSLPRPARFLIPLAERCCLGELLRALLLGELLRAVNIGGSGLTPNVDETLQNADGRTQKRATDRRLIGLQQQGLGPPMR